MERNWFGRLKEKIFSWRLRTQMLLFYGILAAISVTMCVMIYFNLLHTAVRQRGDSVLSAASSSLTTDFRDIVNRMNEYSKLISFDEGTQTALESIIKKQSTAATMDRRVFDLVIESTDMQSIFVFDVNGKPYFSTEDLSEYNAEIVKKSDWYQKALKEEGGLFLIYDAGGGETAQLFDRLGGCLSFVRAVNHLNTQEWIGVSMLNLSEEAVLDELASVAQECEVDIELLNEEGKVCYQYYIDEDFTGGSAQDSIPEKNTVVKRKIGNHNYEMIRCDIAESGWQAVVYLKSSTIYAFYRYMTVTIILICVILAILFIFGGFIFSSRTNRPVANILRSMKKIAKGRFERIDYYPANQEMNILQNGYNEIISQITELFAQAEEHHTQKRKYELDVLQAQIRPHFLYNTFDMIGAMALMGRSDDVFEIMQALGKYYRTSLHKGDEYIKVSEEIEIVKNYLCILKYRFSDLFTVVYDIAPEVYSCYVLKLILQPFVENAVYHGLKEQNYKGEVRIRALLEGKMLHFFIEDTGVGMTEETIEMVLSGLGKTDENKSFGVFGTIERISLYYDLEQPVRIISKPGKGTRIEIIVPGRMDLGER